jgi:hypothetical protein
MRRNLSRIAAALVLPPLVAGSSCWFSTTPPKPTAGSENEDPSAAVVTGNVQLFDRTDHHSRIMPGWSVMASWYTRSGSGTPRLVQRDVTQSSGAGVYEVRFTDPYLVAVDIQGRLCAVDLDGMDCCIGDNPCNRPECTTIWTTPIRINLGPGARERRTVIVACDHVP